MSQHADWTPEYERDAYTAQAQALVEAVAEYEQAHSGISGTPCFSEALAVMRQVCEP